MSQKALELGLALELAQGLALEMALALIGTG